jgi:hypothetical protein
MRLASWWPAALTVWLCVGHDAHATPIVAHGPTTFTISSYGWTQGETIPPGILLGYKTEADRTPGSDWVEQKVVIGPSGSSVAEANAIIRNDGRLFGAAAESPDNYPTPLSAFIGGGAQVQVRNTFRKDSDAYDLSYVFSSIKFQLGWEKEFGLECPPRDEKCQQAVLVSQVDLYNGIDSQPVWSRFNRVEIYSYGGPNNNPGYAWSVPEEYRDFQFWGTVGQTGVDRYTIDPQFIDVDLSAIDVDSLFTVQHTLTVYTFDRASHLAPGRTTKVFAFDPLTGMGGAELRYGGLTPWEELAGSVPSPATGWLILPALALLRLVRRH